MSARDRDGRACRLKVVLEWVKFAIGVLYLIMIHMGFPVYRRYLFGAYTLVCINAAWAEHSNRWAEELEVDNQGDNSEADSFHSCERLRDSCTLPCGAAAGNSTR